MGKRIRWLRRGLYATACLPLMYILFDGFVALGVWWEHGHGPRYGFRGEAFGWSYGELAKLWEWVALPALLGPLLWIAPLALLSTIGMARFRQQEPPYGPAWPRAFVPVWLALVVWALAWGYLIADPFEVMDWVLD
ncbi:MAG: hypothetical protein AAGF84_06670 [Planctomycetota bacterium]